MAFVSTRVCCLLRIAISTFLASLGWTGFPCAAALHLARWHACPSAQMLGQDAYEESWSEAQAFDWQGHVPVDLRADASGLCLAGMASEDAGRTFCACPVRGRDLPACFATRKRLVQFRAWPVSPTCGASLSKRMPARLSSGAGATKTRHSGEQSLGQCNRCERSGKGPVQHAMTTAMASGSSLVVCLPDLIGQDGVCTNPCKVSPLPRSVHSSSTPLSSTIILLVSGLLWCLECNMRHMCQRWNCSAVCFPFPLGKRP